MDKAAPPPAALPSACRPAARVAWTVEIDGIRLFDKARHTVTRLDYPSAAVWDLASRGYGPPQIVAMLARIGSLDPEEAKHVVEESLRAWREAEWLIAGNC